MLNFLIQKGVRWAYWKAWLHLERISSVGIYSCQKVSTGLIHTQINQHAQSGVNRSRENKHWETQLRNTSHNLPLSLSLCPRQPASVCLTHAHKHKAELSDKTYPVIFSLTPSLLLSGLSWQSNFGSLRETKKTSSFLRSEPESSERPTNHSNFYQCSGWQEYCHPRSHTHLIKPYLWSIPGWSVSAKKQELMAALQQRECGQTFLKTTLTKRHTHST